MALKIKTYNKNNELVEITDGAEIDRYTPYIFIGEDTAPPASYDARYFSWSVRRQASDIVVLQSLPSAETQISLLANDLRTNIPYVIELSITYCYTAEGTAVTSTVTQTVTFTFKPIASVMIKDSTGAFVSVHEKLIDFEGPYSFMGGMPNEANNVKGTFKFIIYEQTDEETYRIVLETQFNSDTSWTEDDIELDDNKTYFIEFFFNKFKDQLYQSGKIRFYVSKTFSTPKTFKAFEFHNDIENGVVIGNSVKLMEVYAQGVTYEWVSEENEKGIIVRSGGNIHVEDKYDLLESDFTLRLWLRELPKERFVFTRIFNTPLVGGTITEYINLFYYNNRIYADKATMGKQIAVEGDQTPTNAKLVSQFISRDDLILESSFNSDTDWLFILLKHQDQKIDLWAEIISEENPKANYYAGIKNLYARGSGSNWIGVT